MRTMFPLLFLSLAVSLAGILPPAASYWGKKPPSSKNFDWNTFHQCLNLYRCPGSSEIPISTIYAPSINSTAYNLLLGSTAQNLRCLASPNIIKPVLIFTPLDETQVPPAVKCVNYNFRRFNLKLRPRSMGHDYEGLSYTSLIPNEKFVLLDLQFLHNVSVQVDPDRKGGTAWVQAGATTGELYNKVAEESNGLFGFPAGLCMSLGIGGHLTGGAYGAMMRAYGLGVDHALDARMVLADGSLVESVANRDSDLFWGIRGGGGNNFGVIVGWKLRLVRVPSRVTAFTAVRPLNTDGLNLLDQWQQVAYHMDKRAFVRVLLLTGVSTYNGIYLGPQSKLRNLMKTSLPGLKLGDTESQEMNWLESMVYIGGYPNWSDTDILLTRKPAFLNAFKAKSDFPTTEVSLDGLNQMVALVQQNPALTVIWNPFGGAMANRDVHKTPYPHSNTLGMIQYVSTWDPRDGLDAQIKNMSFMRVLYEKMGPYIVTQGPVRESYVNYKDLDIGRPSRSAYNYSCPDLWGPKYYKDNYDRLQWVKLKFDPWNFFSFEQSIPLPLSWHHKCLKLV